MRKRLLTMAMAAMSLLTASAQQVKETLNRAPVAVTTKSGVLVSWRSLSTDDASATFNVKRDGTTVASGISATTNYLDKAGEAGATYTIEMVVNGNVIETTETTAWDNMFTTIKVDRPEAQANAGGTKGEYRPDDMSVGDLDGDGDYELVLKWMPSDAQDNSKSGYTAPTIIDAYEMDGTRLWRVNLGNNIRSGNHYTQFLVYDFDGDGKAEMICKTAPGSTDGNGAYVTAAATVSSIRSADNTASYPNSSGYILSGPEYLTVFNGETGAAMHTIYYSPGRSGTDFPTGATADGGKSVWGDDYGNRSNRHNAAVAYLDGLDKVPSAIMQRGYYTRCYLWAVDWNGSELTTRWLHRGLSSSAWSVVDADGGTLLSGSGSSSYGSGVHGISIGDVDGDGKDDIVIGSATIGSDGALLCSTGKGHGDAIHLADLVTSRDGLEVMMPHEESPYGYDVHDALTGEVIVSATGTSDNGRGLAADFIPSNPGSEFWSSADNNIYSCTDGTVLLGSKPDTNFRIYWTGDPYDQTFDGRYSSTNGGCSPRIRAYNTSSGSISTVQSFYDYWAPHTCNTTKATPCLQADILGDWREEIIMYKNEEDYTAEQVTLMIFSTPQETQYKVPCLMEDHVYRMGIAWQNSSYNQPPHLGYSLADYLGVDGSTYATTVSSNAPSAPAEEVLTSGTEALQMPAEDKGTVSGTSYTAGAAGEITASESSGYIKIRTGNNGNTITFTVNEGYVITGISIDAYSNNKSTIADRSIYLTGIYIDGSETSEISSNVTFPGGTAGTTPVSVSAKGFAAQSSIVLTFDNSNIVSSTEDSAGKNKQIMAKIVFTYELATGVGTVTKTAELDVEDGKIYTIDGRMATGSTRGIIIKNGKKIVNK